MIAITAALKPEITSLTGQLKNTEVISLLGRKFHVGMIGQKKIITAVIGHGKIDAAASTQLLIREFSPNQLIHIGSAGGLSTEVNIGDFVLGETIVEHDYHCKFNRITPPPQYFTSKTLNQQLLNFSTPQKLLSGVIVSGNEDIIDTERRDELHQLFNGLAVDWESAASTRTCLVNDIETAVIRAVVDGAHEHTDKEFANNLKNISESLCTWIYKYIDSLNRN